MYNFDFTVLTRFDEISTERCLKFFSYKILIVNCSNVCSRRFVKILETPKFTLICQLMPIIAAKLIQLKKLMRKYSANFFHEIALQEAL